MTFYLLFEANTYRLKFMDHVQCLKKHKAVKHKTGSKVAGQC